MKRYFLLALLPWVEIRGAIPLAVKDNRLFLIPWLILVNILIFFPVYFGLELLYDKLKRFLVIDKKLRKAHKKASPYIDKYGLLGLLIFVAIPLPGTGVYTGSAAAWLLRLDWKRAFMAVSGGAMVASLIVLLLSLGVKEGFS
ncbi:MAG: small multi-drug export protein [Candidatus Subteraquimicrobiales bacterium]|nr:small multi-drug export protein [Candidatus Subteraquimicrobiales bacterium]